MRRRRLAELCELNIEFRFYRPRHAAPPKLIRPLLKTWLAQFLLPPAPMQAMMMPVSMTRAARQW